MGKKILTIIFIISLVFLVFFKINRSYNHKENVEIRNFISTPNIYNVSQNVNNNVIDNNIVQNEIENERMIKIKELQKENQDIKGWLEIPNSDISYPVLQGNDNNYYMKHNFKKEYSTEGSLFVDKDYDWNLPSTNLLIYGHNNRGTDEMFCSLMNYKDENYYKEHKIIRFTTDVEDSEYEIISVFLSKVYFSNEKNVFRYYYFINANNEEEFNNYIKNCKENSLYETGITAEFGDELITLSTCEFSQKDGRLAVVARKKTNLLR